MKAFFLIAAFLFPSILWATGDQNAEIFIRRLYGNYKNDPADFNILGKFADTVFSPDLLSLIRIDEKDANGECGVLDWDPICACQDYNELSISDLRIESKLDTTVAHVNIKNGGLLTNVTISLLKRSGKWMICDISNQDMPSLYRYLMNNLLAKHPELKK